jgi:glycine/D-amino acid oxidase-like deaminating enzyme
VEAETAGFGASGRNGGWCSAWLSGIDHWLEQPASRESAIRLQRQMFRTVKDIGELCAAERIDCHYERAGALIYAVNDVQLRRLELELRQVRELGFGDSDYRWLQGADLAGVPAVAAARAAVHMPHCAAIHPARLVHGLASRLEQRGVSIHEQSPVVDWRPGGLTTPAGAIRADTVLLATEGYGARLPGQQRRLIPVYSMMVATEPMAPEALDALGFGRRYCFGNLDHTVTYGQRTADHRIAFGCRGRYYYGSGLPERFEAGSSDFVAVRDTLRRFFPGLYPLRFSHAWGGALGVSRSRRPAVCFDGERRIGWAGGYVGNGVAAAHLAGRTLADLVLGRDSERCETPWVNPPDAARRWEPEPLRWIGFNTARGLMEGLDRREYGGRDGGTLERLLKALMN